MKHMAFVLNFKSWDYTGVLQLMQEKCKKSLDNVEKNINRKYWTHKENSKIQNQKGIKKFLGVSKLVINNVDPL